MSNNLDKRKSLDKKGGALAILIAILWSANPLAAKIGLEDAPIFRLGFMRFALGIFVVVAWGIYTKQSFKISKKSLIPLAISSLVVPIQFAFHLFGQDQTTASHGVIMIVTFPLWAAMFSHFYNKNDRLNKIRVFGLSLAFLGIVVLFWESFNNNFIEYLIGDALILISALILGARLVYVSHITQGINKIHVVLFETVFGFSSFFIISMLFENKEFVFTQSLIISLFYLGIIIAGFGLILQTHVLKTYLPGKVTFFNLFQPILGVFFAWMLLSEEPGIELVISILLVFIGSYFALKK
ncbi:MAG: EamA family transporter [Dehalococcoidales bacterium]|jgi:drug/metabolite transporter (DMT)-like permease|nr:DMT family transporter [Dehalococcoidia bacterium]NCG34790.1 EamA family transporter [Dehalococcoidales bacterium]|tara:strand:+ start:787 stop:1677 length:891 start_codon:yes stop_codon:yes gene_type:complete